MSTMASGRWRSVLALALLSVMFSVGRSEEGSPAAVDLAPDPASLHPADEGALEWEAMSPGERDDVTRARAWAEHDSAAVHDAFGSAVAWTDELRGFAEAQGASGLEGIETLGVVP